MSICGRMGIGRVEGEYNSSGANIGYDDHEEQVEGISAAEQALAAVEALRPSMVVVVGLTTDYFPHVLGEVITYRKAVIVELGQDQVQVQFFNSDGSPAGKTWVSQAVVDKVFSVPGSGPTDPLGQKIATRDWPVVSKLVHVVFSPSMYAAASNSVGEFFTVREAINLMAGCGGVSAAQISCARRERLARGA